MAGLDALVIGGQSQLLAIQQFAALLFSVLEMLEQDFGVGALEIVGAEFLLVLVKHLAVAKLFVEGQVVHELDILDIHGQAFQAIGDLGADRIAVNAAHLLEVCELGDLHPVTPHFPAKSGGAKRGAFPIIFHEPDIVQRRIQANGLDGSQIQLLHILGRGLQDHLILVIVLQPVGVLAITPIGGPARGLHKGRLPGARPQRAQSGGGMKGARAHLVVIGLQDQAALGRPIILQGQDKFLKSLGFRFWVRHRVVPLGMGRNLQAGRLHRKRGTGPQDGLSLGGVGAVRFVQHQAGQQREGRTGALARHQDHPLGRHAGARP